MDAVLQGTLATGCSKLQTARCRAPSNKKSGLLSGLDIKKHIFQVVWVTETHSGETLASFFRSIKERKIQPVGSGVPQHGDAFLQQLNYLAFTKT